MRLIALLIPLLLFGCITFGERSMNGTDNASANVSAPPEPPDNATNQTNMTNETEPPPPPPKVWERFIGKGFSFEYPLNMDVQQSDGTPGGIFSGTHVFDGQTGEIMVVTFTDTLAVYGANKDGAFKTDPTKAASDFLQQDVKSDPAASMLSGAYERGGLTTFGIGRDGSGAQMDFRIRFSGSNKSYAGHAADIYVPERSLLVKARVIALDPQLASDIYQNFLLSFRPE
jgi:hypothetical protein